jgi:DNA polymerase-3 subunit alpha
VFDTVLFPPVAAKYPFRGKGIYRTYGKVVSEFGYLSIEVLKMEKQDVIPDPRYAEMKTSRRLLHAKDAGRHPGSEVALSPGSAGNSQHISDDTKTF